MSFWKEDSEFRVRRLAPYGAYLGVLTIYAALFCWLDANCRNALAGLGGAVALVVLLPILYLRNYWYRYDAFIRCPNCRDWVGRDASGAWSGPNPKWVSISETGCCSQCGTRMISSEPRTESSLAP